ncbi:hypothetical protein Dip510_001593 [Elusimicrobium posterum]|uniref:hypothetical protein n=1 Tax=Elusimicrobium posterum TaxID=3116653 RepID=UPI003C78FCA7
MECEKTILSGAFDVRVAPYNKATPATLADAISIGLTNGGVELTSANEKTAIEVDQLLGSPRFITTKAALGGTINMAEITLENIAKAFDTASQPTVDGDKTVLRIDPNSEKYYTVFLVSKGTYDEATQKTLYRIYHFFKVSFKGTGALNFSRTEAQNLPLEFDCAMSCDVQYFGEVYDTAEVA